MKKHASRIPLHKLSDRHTLGLGLHYISEQVSKKEYVMSAHRDDHYIFIFQQEGKSNFIVDFEDITIRKSSVYCIMPGQVHYLQSTEKLKGWFLAIETMQVDPVFRSVFEENIQSISPLPIGEVPGAQLDAAMIALFGVLQQHAHIHFSSVIKHLAAAIVGIIAGIYQQTEAGTGAGIPRAAVITRQFRGLLRREFITEKSPAQYAAQLNLSLSYLNECVRSETGMPVSYWIRREIIMEAKRLLYYTTLNVKEIAFSLGFEDHTYFSRIFTKETGIAPGVFRRQYRE